MKAVCESAEIEEGAVIGPFVHMDGRTATHQDRERGASAESPSHGNSSKWQFKES
jgi:hypothetical protein